MKYLPSSFGLKALLGIQVRSFWCALGSELLNNKESKVHSLWKFPEGRRFGFRLNYKVGFKVQEYGSYQIKE